MTPFASVSGHPTHPFATSRLTATNPEPKPSWLTRWGRWRGTVWRRRHLIAAACVAAAVALAITQLRPAPPTTTAVLVASRDIAPGHVLTADDVAIARYPPTLAPHGALSELKQPVGQVSARSLSEGSPLSLSDLVGSGLLAGAPAGKRVPVTITLPERISAEFTQTGSSVDVLLTPVDDFDGSAGTASVVVEDALVLAVLTETPPSSSGGTGLAAGLTAGTGSGAARPVLVLGVGHAEAVALAGAASAGVLTVILRE